MDDSSTKSTEMLFNEDDNNDEENHNVDDFNIPECSEKYDELVNELKNVIMFKISNLSVWQVFTAVMAIILRYNLSDEVHQAILDLVKLLAGPDFKFLDTSKYLMMKLFNPLGDAAKYVFYCTKCNIILTKFIPINKNLTAEVECHKCKLKCNTSKKNGNFFVTLDLQSQLKNLLSNDHIWDEIDKNITSSREINEGGISDISSSERYLNDEFIQSKLENNSRVLTLNVNLDGAPLFKSGKKSFWPMQCVINEMPQIIRHKFMLLAGLWYTSTEPIPEFMNLYLSVLKKQIQKLTVEGLQIITNSGQLITYFVKIFAFPVDSVARPVLQNRLQFNGFFGCSWCYQRGVTEAKSMRYPLTGDNVKERDHDSYLRDVWNHEKDIKKLRETKKNQKYTVFGIKGSSILSSIPEFDCIWGFPHDYMHGVLLGVTRQLWNRWSKTFLSADQKKIINARLTGIQPTNDIHRTPQMLLKKKSWKATEWRSWLLFYSVPVLNGILRQDLLDSYKLFVTSIYKLLSTHISEEELLNCEMKLLQFVYDCQSFYGVSFMTFNVHSLLHIVQSVRKNGPLWATSTYPFENNIYNLKLKVTGPNGAVNQMANRTLRYNNFQIIISDESNEVCQHFYNNMIERKRDKVSRSIQIVNEAVLLDQVIDESSEISVYSRCVFKKKMYHGQLYTKTKKTNNSFIKLSDDRMAQIICFLVENESAFIQIFTLDVEKVKGCEHMWKINNRSHEKTVLPISMIKNKMIYISIKALISCEHNQNYLTEQPNSFEVQ